MQIILSWIGGAAIIFVIGFFTGSNWRDNKYQQQHAAQVAQLEKRLADADAAMIEQKRIADAYLARLGELANAEPPPNKREAFDEAAAKRIGAIK